MWIWILFTVFVFGCLAIDLFVFNKQDHVITVKEAGKYTLLWVSVALLFSGVVWWLFENDMTENPLEISSTQAVLDYVTGYLVELSLSMDNLFVIAVIFSAFKIPAIFQHRVLFWGILGAMIFRAVMILFGVALIHQFDWVTYVFGAFLLYTAFTMLKDEDQINPKESWVYKKLTKHLRVTEEIKGHDFFIKKNGKNYATPLFITLIIIEVTDVMFALDSIPAILAITHDEFIAYSSNIMAILGLRSMFFLIVGLLEKFHLINYSLAIVLAFVGIKMLIEDYVEISSLVSLVLIVVVLGSGMLLSLYIPNKKTE